MKKIKILYIIALIITLSGCTDFFELEQPPQNPWNTVQEFERAPIGIYSSMFQGNGWMCPWALVMLPKVSIGDDVDWVNDPGFGYWRTTNERDVNVESAFRSYYVAIAAANDALSFVAKNDNNPYPTATAEDIEYNVNRIIGELHFTRALCYYFMQNMFGHAYVPGEANDIPGIPLRTEFSQGIEDANNPHMGTAAEVFALILADLEKAVEMLPEDYIAGLMHPSYQVRATKFAAIAMQVRTYFMMGNYEKAKEKCDILIDENGGRFDLSEDPIEAFNKSEIGRGKEVIFYLAYYDTNLDGPFHITVLNHNAGTWGNATWCETHMGISTLSRIGWLENPDGADDVLINAKRDKRFQQLFALRYPESQAKAGQVVDNRNEIKEKLTVWSNKYYRGPKKFNTNIPIIRLAEMYLTRSICRYRIGDKIGAAADLNMVRKRSWDESIGGEYVNISANDITEQMIGDERIIEMFVENDRIDYLKGLKVDIPDGERGTGAKPYTDEDFFWVLPDGERLYNESL